MPSYSPISNPDVQLVFLQHILQVTHDSNGDPQVLYPLLQENQNQLNDNLAQLLRSWTMSFIRKVEPEQAKQQVALDVGNFSLIIQDFPQGNKASNLEIAMAGYEIVSTVFTRHDSPTNWAMTQKNLANIYENRIRGERAENLEQAIHFYQQALNVYTCDAFPQDWAQINFELGRVYSDRIRGERSENLEQAIHFYQQALDVYTRDDSPAAWGRTHINLGGVYRNRIRGERAENLEQAIDHCTQASEVIIRKIYPQEWAIMQNILGIIYIYRIRGERAENLELAIQHCVQALERYTHNDFPQEWAMVQISLGGVYKSRIHGERAENLEQAIRFYQKALNVYTRDAFPFEWAMTHMNIGNVYWSRIRGERKENLENAIHYCRQTLEVITRHAHPKEWAMIHNILGLIYSDRIRGERSENLEQAILYFQQALDVYTRNDIPFEWARIHNNLGLAYRNRILGRRAQNLEKAIYFYQQALEVYTRDHFPFDWAMTQKNLGNIWSDRILGKPAENLEQAICCYRQALHIYTRDNFPEDWAKTQNNLGNAYNERIHGDKQENQEQAIHCLAQALDVYTHKAFPENWAATNINLGNAYISRLCGNSAKNLEQAICCYEQALDVYTREAFPAKYAGTLFNIALAYQQINELQKAYKLLKDAIDTVESLRNEIFSGDEAKQKLAEEWNKLYSSIVNVCLELGNHTEAIEYAERSKTRNLVELILSHDLNSIFSPEISTQLQNLQEEISSGQYRLQTATADDPVALAKHLVQLRQQRNDLQDSYLPIGSSFKLNQLQTTLNHGTAIVEFYITETQLISFIFTNQSQQPVVLQFDLKNLQKLAKWINGYLKAYMKSKEGNKKESHWQRRLTTRLRLLAQILHIDTIIAKIPKECNRLILIPHRYLHLFPLHALPLTGKTNLFERFPKGVHYIPSGQLLQLAQKRERPYFSHLFAIQNPTGDLAYTDIEVEIIQSYFKQTNILKKVTATKLAIESNDLNTFHCAHFGCHGYFNLINPRNSALILADAQLKSVSTEPDSEYHLSWQDNEVLDLKKCLTLDNIFKLNLEQCRLVTMSACETGLIDFNNTSDEYIGLPSGFLYAGSQCVVSSLWRVSDLSTAFLMAKFYENLQKQTSVALSLNQAQLWLKNITGSEIWQWIQEKHISLSPTQRMHFRRIPANHRPFQDPFHWAAFCAIGES